MEWLPFSLMQSSEIRALPHTYLHSVVGRTVSWWGPVILALEYGSQESDTCHARSTVLKGQVQLVPVIRIYFHGK